MQNIEDSINSLRKKIDNIDNELAKLLKERSEIVHEVGVLKHKSGAAKSMVRPGREAGMIRKVAKRDLGIFPKYAASLLWRLIISASISLEEKITILVDKNDKNVIAPVNNYYAGILEVLEKNNVKEILAAAAKNKKFIAVIPTEGSFYKDSSVKKLFSGENSLKIFGIIPFVYEKKPKNFYYLVGRATPEETDNDISLFIGKNGLTKKSGFVTENKAGIYVGSYAKEFQVK